MDSAADMHERHARLLGRLADLGMALAEDLQARALAAETPEEAEKLAAGFHRLSRSVRQSLALEAKLRRDAQRADRETVEQQQAEAAKSALRKRAEARARLDRLIWTEAEDEHTARFWQDGAERLLAEAEFREDFETADLDTIIETLAQALRDQPLPQTGPPKPHVTVEWQIVDPRTGKSSPLGEVDPKGTEGVEAHSAQRSAPQPPQSAFADSSPSGEHLVSRPRGLPGELPPDDW